MIIQLVLWLCVRSEETKELFGSVDEEGYYYTDLWLGSHASVHSLIIDTGSKFTWLACDPCVDCGSHKNPGFNYFQSFSSKKVSCFEGVACTKCENNFCEYELAYSDGSSISGLFINDTASLTNKNSGDAMIFGCNNRETNLDKTNQVDGILGLAEGIPNIFDVISKKKTDFAICLGHKNGYLTYNKTFTDDMSNETLWASMNEDKDYKIQITDVKVDEETIELNLSEEDIQKGSLIDSATSFVYLQSDIYDKILKKLNSFCDKKDENCGNSNKDDESHICFEYRTQHDSEEFFDSFPTITFMIDDENAIDWKPENYLYVEPGDNQNYCIGVFNNQNNGNILGAVFMRGMNIIFDRSNGKIGFYPDTCKSIPDNSESNGTSSKDNEDQTADKNQEKTPTDSDSASKDNDEQNPAENQEKPPTDNEDSDSNPKSNGEVVTSKNPENHDGGISSFMNGVLFTILGFVLAYFLYRRFKSRTLTYNPVESESFDHN